jgi:murein DD-endopeptidase MepM/ murein hydrolase activator NlpD
MGLAVAGFALAASVAAGADGPLTSATTTTGATTTVATTTAPPADTTPDSGVYPPPTTPATTTAPAAPATTAPAPATTAATTTAPPPPPAGRYAALRQLGEGCLVVAAAAVAYPSRAPQVLGSFAQAPRPQTAGSGAFYFPGDGAVVATSGSSLSATSCAGERGSADHGPTGKAFVQSVSLFGGFVTADAVSLTLTGGSETPLTGVDGLKVDGKPTSFSPGSRVDLGGWGYLVALAGPANEPEKGNRTRLGALEIHLTAAHGGLPAGTDVLVPFAGAMPAPEPEPEPMTTAPAKKKAAAPAAPHRTTPATTPEPRTARARPAPTPGAPARPEPLPPGEPVAPPAKAHVKKQKKHRPPTEHHKVGHQPLTVTPPLGKANYVFPIAGEASFGNSYGGPRSDVPGGWHHGDDIFSALGTPVVAVADGTLNRVGWNRIGGWRLWVRDRRGNYFYYAHLSGYTEASLHDKHVKAGEVIGFVGNTGDAITTPPHLHFEIHPVSLLSLDYDGAVNPTSYLEGWERLDHVDAPVPVHATLPKGAAAEEAKLVFRQLLAARGITPEPEDLPAAPFGISTKAPELGVGFVADDDTIAVASTRLEAADGVADVSMVVPALLLAGAGLVSLGSLIALQRRADRDLT